MTVQRSDGSVESANTPTSSNSFQDNDSNIYKVLLTKVYYSDDRKNISRGGQNPEVLYDGLILGGNSEGHALTNIRDASSLTGGKNNYAEHIYRTNTFPVTGTGKVDINKQDGDVVYVAYIQGKADYPIIVGRATGVLDGDKTGALRADGPRRRWEYNGIFFEVNKNGEMTLTRKGGQFQAKEGFFEPEEGGDKVTFSLTDSKLTATFAKTGITEVHDGIAQLVTLTFKSGLKVTIDGASDQVKIVTAGGTQTLVDGAADKATIETAGGAKASIDGASDTVELQDNGSGKLKISGEKVALGASPAELLDLFEQTLDALIAQTHIGNLGIPTGTPINVADFTAIKTLLTQIKGTL